MGGMTWSGYAFDPEHNLLLVRTNNIAAVAKLIPSEKLEDAARSGEDGDYEPQTGSPYGMYRRFLQSSSDLPCSPPPWGMLSAVDMKQGTIRWQVPPPLTGCYRPGDDPRKTRPFAANLGAQKAAINLQTVASVKNGISSFRKPQDSSVGVNT
jgi:glucose dehydrogenase